MNFVSSTNCNNDSKCSNFSDNGSIIVIQRFKRENEKLIFGMKEVTQTRILRLQLQSHISITVNVEVNKSDWKTLSVQRKNSLWLQFKKQLYWSCETSNYQGSLCISTMSKASSTLIIRMYDNSESRNQQFYVQCSVCFLKSSNIEVINRNRVSQHLKTLVFNTHHYLPHKSLSELSNIILNLTRRDIIHQNDHIDKVFITNISIINTPKDTYRPKTKCRFICGWGPQCLEKVTDVCDDNINCVQGEDEDNRLCSAFNQGVFSLEKDFSRSSNTTNTNNMDQRVKTTFYTYLFVIICVNILLIMIVLFILFVRKSREYESQLHNKKSKLLKSSKITQDLDMTCNTCEMKSRTNFMNDHYKRSINQIDDLAFSLSIPETKTLNSGLSNYYHNTRSKCALKQPQSRPNRFNGSKVDKVSETKEWLNLFVHVSSEARHKGLLNKPPPNVNNIKEKSFNCAHAFSTSSICVFPTMN